MGRPVRLLLGARANVSPLLAAAALWVASAELQVESGDAR